MEGPIDNSASLGAMGSLLRKLNKLLQTEDRESIIRKFRDDVDSIYKKLEKLSEVRDPPRMVNCWMKDVRELSYDMEDFINGLEHGCDAGAKMDEISEFYAEVVDAIDRYDCYNLEQFLKQDSDAGVKLGLGSVFAETKLVGMDDHIKELRSVVKPKSNGGKDSDLKVVSILSVDEGVGKSMLARKLWRDELETSISKEKESESESCRAFVLMAKKPDMRMTLRSILSQVRPHEPPGDYRVPNLIHDIRKHLKNKRYFIVIDDLWAISFWDIVRRAFPDGKNCSRIIITTTVEDVARACCSDRYNIVDIKPLSDKQPNELFFSRVFGPGKEYPQQLYFVSNEITSKCGGLPLAIICIATLVASQEEIKQQLDIVRMEQQLEYVNNFLHTNLRTNPTPVDILNQVLKLCYSSLPHSLKTCLLYLSMYPENYLILKEDLLKQWIAEGFICPAQEKDTVEVATSYFDDLVSLGLIQQQIEINCNKKYQPYAVHPVVFDFIKYKSMEDNFITIIDYSQSTVVLTEKIRRLSLHFGSATYARIPARTELSQVRSLAFTGLLGCMPSLVEFKLVRVVVLHLQGYDGNVRFSLSEVRNLILLIYMQVRSNVIVDLPEQLGSLKHLETLEINAQVATVPSDIVRHPSLLHVRLGTETKHKHHTPGRFTSSNIFPDVLRRSPSQTVEVLELLPPVCSFSRLPVWIQQLRRLRILEVVVRELCAHDVDQLAKLPLLTTLSLYVCNSSTAESVLFRRGAFPALVYLKLVSGKLLLIFLKEAVPNLRTLQICLNTQSGGKYGHTIGGLHHLLNLQEVAARIGVATDAEETEFIALKLALQDAIDKHPCRVSFNVTKVEPVDYDPPEIHDWSQMAESSYERDEVLNQHIDTQKGDSTIDKTSTILEEMTVEDVKKPTQIGTSQFSDPLEDNSSTHQKSAVEEQYKGVTFYSRTGRWESHIWDRGEQVYLGDFDTAHAAARAYDRAAIKFRGLEADINFTLGDYKDDLKQMRNWTEEFVVPGERGLEWTGYMLVAVTVLTSLIGLVEGPAATLLAYALLLLGVAFIITAMCALAKSKMA